MTPDAPPLPELASDTTNDPPAAYNNWRVLTEEVPLFAERPIFVPSKKIPLASRSPFRTGVIHFAESGIALEGMAVKPPPRWLPYVGLLAVLPQLSGQFLASYAKRLGMPFRVRMIFLFGGIAFAFLPIWLRNRFDRQRVETNLSLSWESLQAIVVGKRFDYITLIYCAPAVPRAKETLREYVSLTNLDPATISGIANTIRHFAPGVERENKENPQNPRWVWIVFCVLIFVLTVLIAVLVIRYYRRRSVP